MKTAYRFMTLILVGALVSGGVVSVRAEIGSEEKRGARALFLDPTSRVTVMANNDPEPLITPSSYQQNTPVSYQPANTGLMYYVELRESRGSSEVLRVNATRDFRSGESIRLRFTSNINGYLFITQEQNNGPRQLLFPDRKAYAGSNRVQAFRDTAIPSERAWFTFDNNPGEIRLQVFLVAADKLEQIPDVIRSLTAPGNISNESRKAQDMLIAEGKPRGSRALMIEVDEVGRNHLPATYVVSDNDAIVPIEIILNHVSGAQQQQSVGGTVSIIEAGYSGEIITVSRN
jgi:hypothetical protein